VGGAARRGRAAPIEGLPVELEELRRRCLDKAALRRPGALEAAAILRQLRTPPRRRSRPRARRVLLRPRHRKRATPAAARWASPTRSSAGARSTWSS